MEQKAPEKEACGIKLTTWAKILNMGLGAAMVTYSILTMFTVALDAFSSSPILIISFRVYEV